MEAAGDSTGEPSLPAEEVEELTSPPSTAEREKERAREDSEEQMSSLSESLGAFALLFSGSSRQQSVTWKHSITLSGPARSVTVPALQWPSSHRYFVKQKENPVKLS